MRGRRRVGLWLPGVVAVSMVLCAAGAARSAVYYVDFEGGTDGNDGLSPAGALKHCPGDPAAAGKAKAIVPGPGDTVIFKGGVVYRGSVNVAWAGEQDKPITYDGNTAGSFGQGRAVIDGSEPLTEWKPCESAEVCGGNANWQKLYCAYLPRTPMYRVCLYEGDEFLALARDPNMPDPFWPEDLGTLRPRVDPDPFLETDVGIAPGKALRVNPGRPMTNMLDGNESSSAILEPLVGAEFTITPGKPATAASLAVANHLQAGYSVAREVSFAADGKEILKVALKNERGLQRFALAEPVTFKELAVKVHSAYGDSPGLGAIAEIQAYDVGGANVLHAQIRTAYVDATYFTQTDPHYWDGACFLVPASGALAKQKVIGYDPAKHKIIVAALSGSVYRRESHARYCTFGMLNALGILDAPGEFHFDETRDGSGRHKVTLWPRNPGPEGPRSISYAARHYAFDIRSAGFVTIQGFRIQKLGGSGGDPFAISNQQVKEGRGIVIRGNEILRIGAGRRAAAIALTGVKGALIDGNQISLNRYSSGLVASGCADLVTSNNTLHKNGATAIDYYGCQDSKLLHNTLTDHRGVHANGLTLYNGNKGCLVEGNRVSGGNNGMTIQGAEDIVIRNNIFDGHDEVVSLAIWPQRPFRNVKVLNNVFLRTSKESSYAASLFSNSQCIEGLVVKNNIMDGYALEHYPEKLPGEFTNNIYTHIGPTDQKKRGLGAGEIFEPDLKKIFRDPDHDDYRPAAGSPAIDAGADVGLGHDIVGTKVPQGKAPDIGAYEHVADGGGKEMPPGAGVGDAGTRTDRFDREAAFMTDVKTKGTGVGGRCEITVGPSGADVTGTDGRAIQIAIDAAAYRGGGTVRVLPGEYVLEDAIRLRSNIALVGERDRTILRRGRLVWSRLAVDADTGQKEITPADARGFRPGMGVCLRDNRSGWAFASQPYVITEIRDGVLHLNDYLTSERYAEAGGIVVNYFPLILGTNADNVVVDGFTADASVEDDGALEGMRSAVVYFFRCAGGTIRNVVAKNGRGDGICVGKTSVNATIEDCETYGNTHHGIHPGSHSARCTVRRCHIHHNGSDGLYICWGIHHSRFEDNEIHHNGGRELRSGISIGHKDTDNVIARNRIYENYKFGICVRQKTEANGAHRNVFRDNVIENNGTRPEELAEIKKRLLPWEAVGCGVHVCGITKDLVLENNIIRETRQGDARTQRHAVCLRPGVSGMRMRGNAMEGHPGRAVLDESECESNELQKE